MNGVSYEIETEVPKSYQEKLLDFIDKKYLLPQKDRFRAIVRKKADEGSTLSYSVLDVKGNPSLQVEVKAAAPLKVSITPLNEQVADAVVEEAKQDIVIALQIFEENMRQSTL